MSITLSTAIEKFLNAKRAKGFSENTLSAYSQTFAQFRKFLNADINIDSVDSDTIINFLASRQAVSNKTKRNHHTVLSSLWTFLINQGMASKHIPRQVEAPMAEKRQINPFSQYDINALLTVSDTCQNPVRNRAIILLLLDMGMRATELCSIKLRDVDVINRRIRIFGKGSKERYIPFSTVSQEAINTYLSKVRKVNIVKDKNQYLFISKVEQPFDRNGLSQTLERLAAQANIYPCNPHRYRHTFAIQFLRNGGNIYTLQRILGHTTLDMVKKYLAIAQCDLDRDHELASPVKKWGLDALPQTIDEMKS